MQLYIGRIKPKDLTTALAESARKHAARINRPADLWFGQFCEIDLLICGHSEVMQ